MGRSSHLSAGFMEPIGNNNLPLSWDVDILIPEVLPRAEISCPVGTSVIVLGDIGFHLTNRQSRRKQQPTSIATNNIKQQLKSVVICERNHFIIAHSTPSALRNYRSPVSTGFTGGYSYSSPSDVAHQWKISPLRGFFNKGIASLQRFRRYAVVLALNPIVSPGEQSEAITTHQIVTSV